MRAFALFLIAVVTARGAWAQDNYKIQVYASEFVLRGATMVELHSNYTFREANVATSGMRSTLHAAHS